MSKKIVKDMIVGNQSYRIDTEVLESIKKGQSPKITLVTCSDSRISGHIMNRDLINHVFHIRNIGNQIENNDGSIDYGIYHLKTPILLILGHTDCGAVKASQTDFSKESLEIRKELYPLFFALRNHSNKTITSLVQANVDAQVELAMNKYPEADVVGAVFDIHGDFGEEGRIVITNIKGIMNVDILRNHPLVSELNAEIKDVAVRRV